MPYVVSTSHTVKCHVKCYTSLPHIDPPLPTNRQQPTTTTTRQEGGRAKVCLCFPFVPCICVTTLTRFHVDMPLPTNRQQPTTTTTRQEGGHAKVCLCFPFVPCICVTTLTRFHVDTLLPINYHQQSTTTRPHHIHPTVAQPTWTKREEDKPLSHCHQPRPPTLHHGHPSPLPTTSKDVWHTRRHAQRVATSPHRHTTSHVTTGHRCACLFSFSDITWQPRVHPPYIFSTPTGRA